LNPIEKARARTHTNKENTLHRWHLY